MSKFVLTVQCQTQRGIVAAITTYLATKGCNITDSAQFDDLTSHGFFMRISFVSELGHNLETLEAGFQTIGQNLQCTINSITLPSPCGC